MPLFGQKHNDATGPGAYDNTMDGTHTHNKLHRNPDPVYDQSGPGVGSGAGGMGTTHGHGLGHHNQGYAAGGQGAYDDTGLGGPNMGPGGAAHTSMPPRTDAHGNPEHPSGGSKFAGKVESTLGSVLGSSSLKQKGMEKQQESRALRAQAAELDVAEQHEQEALKRRERAVAHGAHPDHGYLGSHNPNTHAGGGLNDGQGYGTGTGTSAGMNDFGGPGRRGHGGAGTGPTSGY